MSDLTRRDFVTAGAALAGTAAAGKLRAQQVQVGNNGNGFQAASAAMSGGFAGGEKRGPGIQGICALCEVTGGGEKVYGIAVEYDAVIDPASLALDTYTTSVFPAANGFFAGMPQEPDKNATTAAPKVRPVAAVYTNAEPALRSDRKSVAGMYVIAEFEHDPDLSIPIADSDKVSLTQDRNVKTAGGAVYAAAATVWTNTGPRGLYVSIRGVDAWEQSH